MPTLPPHRIIHCADVVCMSNAIALAITQNPDAKLLLIAGQTIYAFKDGREFRAHKHLWNNTIHVAFHVRNIVSAWHAKD